MLLVGIIIGLVVGLNLGLFFGKRMLEGLYNTVIDSYKRDEKMWFDEYLKVRGYYNEMTTMWLKEVQKNIGK